MKPGRILAVLLLGGLLAGLAPPLPAEPLSDFQEERKAMIRDIAGHWRSLGSRLEAGPDAQVLGAMANTPRHLFVPDHLRKRAYEDRPLPIGHGQTISQPFIVALMTQLLETGPDDVVLEVGTGSGYQAAVLSPLVAEVYTIEIIPQLAEQARRRLERLHLENVQVRTGDGYYGWEEHAPFDAVVVTAAADHVPPPLVRQLKPGGRMVIPVGSPFTVQQLMLVEKHEDGSVTNRQLLPVAFVPLTGKH